MAAATAETRHAELATTQASARPNDLQLIAPTKTGSRIKQIKMQRPTLDRTGQMGLAVRVGKALQIKQRSQLPTYYGVPLPTYYIRSSSGIPNGLRFMLSDDRERSTETESRYGAKRNSDNRGTNPKQPRQHTRSRHERTAGATAKVKDDRGVARAGENRWCQKASRTIISTHIHARGIVEADWIVFCVNVIIHCIYLGERIAKQTYQSLDCRLEHASSSRQGQRHNNNQVDR